MAKEKAKQLAQQPKLTSFLSPCSEVDTAGAADLQLTAQLEELPQLEDLTPLVQRGKFSHDEYSHAIIMSTLVVI